MFRIQMKPTTVFGVVLAGAAVLGLPGLASAQPGAPTGLKGYGLMQWQQKNGQWSSSSRSQPSRAYNSPRSYSNTYPAYYGYASPVSPAVVWSQPVASPVPTSPAQATVAIRGADGVMRSFPVDAGAVQRQAATPGQAVQSFVNILGTDGVVRSYPVTTTLGHVIVSTGTTGVTHVTTTPCR